MGCGKRGEERCWVVLGCAGAGDAAGDAAAAVEHRAVRTEGG